jgi:hypothetical protein
VPCPILFCLVLTSGIFKALQEIRIITLLFLRNARTVVTKRQTEITTIHGGSPHPLGYLNCVDSLEDEFRSGRGPPGDLFSYPVVD